MVHHLYFHIPFCHHICPYCGFYKHKPGGTDLRRFVDSLGRELRWAAERTPLELKTVYLGGGTPSLLSDDLWERFSGHLAPLIQNELLDEFCLEANPKTFTEKRARLWRDTGVTRVSLGVQSMNPETLKVLGRDHSPAEAVEAFASLRSAGIPAVNVDLMFAIPGQTLGSWNRNLDDVLSLQPDHISTYNLTYEEDTEFLQKFENGEWEQDADRDAEYFEVAHHRLDAEGFQHYEISNHSRPGFESRHNLSAWRGADYLGIGPGAVSTIDGIRWTNLPDTSRWMDQIESVGHARVEAETLTEDQQKLERLALGLRTTSGIDLTECGVQSDKVSPLVEEGLVETFQKETRLRLTLAGMMVADEVTAFLSE